MKTKKITRLFDLKGSKTSKKKLSIRLIFRINGEKYSYYVGHTILPEFWNYKKQEAKPDVGFLDSVVINNALDATAKAFDKAKYQLLKENIPVTRDAIIGLMDETLGRCTAPTNDFWGFVEQFIKSSSGRVNARTGEEIKSLTIQKYKDIRNILQRFETYDNRKMRFETINVEWFDRFNRWCTKEGYAVNTIDKAVKVMKVWLNTAVRQKVTKCRDYEYIKTRSQPTTKTYLTDDELLKIYNAKLSCEKYENARDLFLLGCYTGLRYSDTSTIERGHIKEKEGKRGRISIHQAKTGTLVTISMHPILKDILEKRNWSPPRSLSNQKLNEYIKQVCKEAGITEPVEIQTTKAGVRKKEIKPKWMLMSSHTARRSFASNLYRERVPMKSIMKLTGHRTIQSFMSYIQLTDDEHLGLIDEVWDNVVVLKEAC
jgi:integrase